MRLKAYAAQTHQGPYLQVNEDGYDFDFDNQLYMIFDGLGGSGIGDTCVDRLKQDVKQFYTQLSDDPNATMPLYYNPRNTLEENSLINSLLNAHQKIYQSNAEKPINQRAAASGIVATMSESLLVLLGVGNCVAYHFRKGRLHKLIQEDTLQFLSKDQFEYKFRTIPFSAIGMYPDVNYQLKEVRVSDGDQVILMTDGVYGYVSEEELTYTMTTAAPDLTHRLNTLLKLSNSRGNTDNQTVMILEF
ncbi:MAG: PP2C family protein-serine/threonine phosphatase [Bacteriovoracaceae bacterium]|jgi:serine/threonine protein phosphatase PrpC